MTARVAFVGDSHLASLALAVRSMAPGHLKASFFADVLKRLRDLQVVDGCLLPGNHRQRKILLETSGGLDRIDPTQYDLFVLMGLGFEFPYHCLARGYFSRAVVEQTTRDMLRDSLAMDTLAKLRRVTDGPAWMLHQPLSATPREGQWKGQWKDRLPYDRFLTLAEEEFGPLDATVVAQPAETRIDDRFSLPEFSRDPVSIDNRTGEAGSVREDNHHKNEAFGQAVIRDLVTKVQEFSRSGIGVNRPWRPRKRGTIQEETESGTLIIFEGRRGARLDPVAESIWKLCDGTRTLKDLLLALADLYSVPPDQIWLDLPKTLNSLVQIGVVAPPESPDIRCRSGLPCGGPGGESLEIAELSELPTISFCAGSPDNSVAARFRSVVSNIDVKNVFNPSFLEREGIRVYAFRAIPEGSADLVSFVSISDDRNHSLHRIAPEEFRGLDAPRFIDPKIFAVGEEVYLTFNSGWIESGNEIFVMKVYPTLEQPKKVLFEHRRRQERNWGFFAENGEVYALYQISPLVILKLEKESDDAWWMVEVGRQPVVDAPLDLTIGTQPCKHEGRYYLIAHRKFLLGLKKLYLGRLCAFEPDGLRIEAKGPWLAHSPESLRGHRIKHNTNLFSCTYFSGLQIVDSMITLGYGINDVDFGFSRHPLPEMR